MGVFVYGMQRKGLKCGPLTLVVVALAVAAIQLLPLVVLSMR